MTKKLTNTLPPTATPLPPASKPVPRLPAKLSVPGRQAHIPKTFTIQPWTDAGEGRKVVVYSKSGGGKTTLASMAPNAVFLGIDDGGRKITNPITGRPIDAVPGVSSYQDIRDALNQPNLWTEGQTIVIDTLTKVEELTTNHLVETVTDARGGKVKNFRSFGWDGERHLLDATRLLLTDLDAHVKAGRNVIILCQLAQVTVANAEGYDYLEDGPKLQHRKDCSCRTEVIEWADDVARIGYLDLDVRKDDAKDKAGKVVNASEAARAIFTGGAQHYIAKSRPVSGHRIPSVIGFDNPADDSLWQFLFHGARVGAAEGGQV